MKKSIAQRLCELYVKKAEVIGFLYCVIPVIGWFAYILLTVPFREVYILRIILSIGIGGPFAAFLNRFGLSLWIIKHGSPKGPGTVRDGIFLGALLGIGMSIFPSLTSLIATNHLETAKTFIIASWLIAGFIGAVIGGNLAAFGKKYFRYKNYLASY